MLTWNSGIIVIIYEGIFHTNKSLSLTSLPRVSCLDFYKKRITVFKHTQKEIYHGYRFFDRENYPRSILPI